MGGEPGVASTNFKNLLVLILELLHVAAGQQNPNPTLHSPGSTWARSWSRRTDALLDLRGDRIDVVRDAHDELRVQQHARRAATQHEVAQHEARALEARGVLEQHRGYERDRGGCTDERRGVPAAEVEQRHLVPLHGLGGLLRRGDPRLGSRPAALHRG
eukprot:scaffold16245_cov67-Phaeocystis_antarctica.AAC.2